MSDTNRDAGQDVADFLTGQHSQMRHLFAEVMVAEPDQREEVFRCLVWLMAVHETIEEEVVHPAVKGEAGGESVVADRLEEEHYVKALLSGLEKMDLATDEFMVAFESFESTVVDHAAHEESEEFPILERMEDVELLDVMRSKIDNVKEMAPSHPHPHTHDSATSSMVVGPFVAAADLVHNELST